MNRDTPYYRYARQIAVGLAASGGLLCAASVSGLPAITCKPLAYLYGDAIETFGTAGFSGIAIIGILVFPPVESKLREKGDFIVTLILLGIGMFSILGGMLESLRLSSIVRQCWH